MTPRLSSIPKLLVLGILLGTATGVRATVLEPVTLDDLTDQAELIFTGVVTDIDYGMSEQDSPDQPRLPFTFVTFYIERTMKGSSREGEAITLRFEGGPADNGKLLYIPGIPLFDVGDHDILFVRDNGIDLAPIVGWTQGRFRIIRGELFSDDGHELHANAGGGLAQGRRDELDEVSKNRIGEVVFETVNGGEDEPEPDLQVAQEPGPRSPRLSVGEFESLVSEKVRAHNGRGAAAVRSAEKHARIVVPADHPVGPPVH